MDENRIKSVEARPLLLCTQTEYTESESLCHCVSVCSLLAAARCALSRSRGERRGDVFQGLPDFLKRQTLRYKEPRSINILEY